jgi:hypothetical protein
MAIIMIIIVVGIHIAATVLFFLFLFLLLLLVLRIRVVFCLCYRPALYILLSEEWRWGNLPSCSNLRALWLISAVQGTNQQLTRQKRSYDHLNGYCVVDSYHEDRTHLGLGKGTPDRTIRSLASGRILAHERLGVLHHCYDRAA